ncbi:pyridoxamine 5'-phosphate oxidase family protein [Streptomyces sp. NPDC032940]|uniref:pyridoxamine 5'-phosphate oxidase family protein n=1 Tax=Streptomyces sp. NPDC032940 TaxID=3155366 RepID=UPI0033D673AB
MYRNDGFRELDRQECLHRLALADVGRVVFTHDALPAVLPVHFLIDRDGSVLLRTSAASEMAHAVDGSVVAFEVDRVDAAANTGWSVVVTGLAAVVTDPAEWQRLTRSGPRSWLSWPAEIFVRIEPGLVTGRELLGGRTMYGVYVFT